MYCSYVIENYFFPADKLQRNTYNFVLMILFLLKQTFFKQSRCHLVLHSLFYLRFIAPKKLKHMYVCQAR